MPAQGEVLDSAAGSNADQWYPLAPDAGVKKRVIRPAPTGAELAMRGHQVTCHYTGRVEGEIEPFDSSREREKPFEFMLGVGAVIPGWDLAFLQMRVGERSELHHTARLEARYAYGDQGHPPRIPGGATLLFDVDLISSGPKQKELSEMTDEEKIAEASARKAQGVESFAAKDWRSARRSFAEAARFCDAEAYALHEEHGEGPRWPEALKAIFLSSQLNMSQCCLQEAEWPSTAAYATRALSMEPANVKALYRRGVARCHMGLLDEAKADLVEAARLDPKNKAVRDQYAALKKIVATQTSTQKKTFAAAFDKVSLFPEKPRNLTRPSETENPYVFFDFEVRPKAKKAPSSPSEEEAAPAAGAVVEKSRFMGGRVVARVYADACPRTARNFMALCTGANAKKRCYRGCHVHRVVENFLIQTGDVLCNDGTSGESIYGPTFADEHFKVPHDRPGVLSMANRGPNTNASQFFITTKVTDLLNGKHVVFGQVVANLALVEQISKLKAGADDEPRDVTVVITNCGPMRVPDCICDDFLLPPLVEKRPTDGDASPRSRADAETAMAADQASLAAASSDRDGEK